ncbi:MAG TPA: hypothetical protein VNW04_03465 [Puia sp.]|jgi:hypothetical protein|nr:hypothetical protein [Puia sp.]
MRTISPYRPFIAAFLAGAALLTGATSCAKLNITNYYHKHRPALDSIEDTYRRAYNKKPFSIEFTDRPFDRVSLELITDTLTYIYEYHIGETRLQDTLRKYGYDTLPVDWLINRMRSMNCTWIDKLDYYSEDQRHSLIYLSLWPRTFNSPFVNKKYYILTYFQQPQYFDSQGRLLTGRRRRHIRKINAAVFLRLNDKTAYTISDRFR